MKSEKEKQHKKEIKEMSPAQRYSKTNSKPIKTFRITKDNSRTNLISVNGLFVLFTSSRFCCWNCLCRPNTLFHVDANACDHWKNTFLLSIKYWFVNARIHFSGLLIIPPKLGSCSSSIWPKQPTSQVLTFATRRVSQAKKMRNNPRTQDFFNCCWDKTSEIRKTKQIRSHKTSLEVSKSCKKHVPHDSYQYLKQQKHQKHTSLKKKNV